MLTNHPFDGAAQFEHQPRACLVSPAVSLGHQASPIGNSSGQDLVTIPRNSYSKQANDLATVILSVKEPRRMPGLTEQATDFCRAQRILTYIPLAEGLVRKHFPRASGLRWDLEKDPDTRRRWMVLNFDANEPVTEAMEHYDAVTDGWIAKTPWPQTDLISFYFTVLE